MKKFSLIALIASSVLFVACGDKKVTDGVTDAVSSAASEAVDATKQAASETVEKATDAVKETATKAVEATKEAATATVEKATDAVKETATKAVEATKDAASSTVEAVSGAATATATAAAATATSSSDGKALYAKCASCHGADGKTKALGKSEIIAGQSAADLETKITEYKAGSRDVAGMGALMKSQVGSYSEADIKAVAEYISTLK